MGLHFSVGNKRIPSLLASALHLQTSAFQFCSKSYLSLLVFSEDTAANQGCWSGRWETVSMNKIVSVHFSLFTQILQRCHSKIQTYSAVLSVISIWPQGLFWVHNLSNNIDIILRDSVRSPCSMIIVQIIWMGNRNEQVTTYSGHCFSHSNLRFCDLILNLLRHSA